MRPLTRKFIFWFSLLLGCAVHDIHAAERVVQHELEVSLDPERHSLQVRDHVRLPEESPLQFTLHRGLEPRILTPGVTLTKTRLPTLSRSLQIYRLSLPDGVRDFTLEYGGEISHGFRTRAESPGRHQQLLSGTISNDGVFLDAGVAWYPVFPDSLQRFSLSVELPSGWLAVSQGSGPDTRHPAGKTRVTWQENHPQDDIYLIAAPFRFYAREKRSVQPQVFLRQPDPALAERYLDATEQYLQLYQALIGPYPYSKFALVENFWETGYGMPSFTLLGPRVIRLPFILHTSFPHEILHNWWGNGVYVDYPSGNWSEGLTAYLADHLLKEQQGKGVEYRRSALQRFSDFVRTENDFPLRDFRSRHTTASQAVGYDKGLMFYHMLRRKLGDHRFIEGLRRFYLDYRFKTAGYADLQQAFEAVSDLDLADFFQQWTQRIGAPALALEDLKLEPQAPGYRLTGTLLQTQQSAAFRLEVPVVVYLQGNAAPIQRKIPLDSKRQAFSLELPAKPLRLDIDPWFDLFRQLDDREAPPTLSKLFGAEQVLFVLPAAAPAARLQAYRQLVEQWSAGYPKAQVLLDRDLQTLPKQGSVWLLGWENRFTHDLLRANEISLGDQQPETFRLGDLAYRKDSDSLVFVNRPGASTQRIIGMIAGHSAQAIEGLTSKLPHYGKYSYLVFSGEAPNNRLKGQWELTSSPLRILFSAPGKEFKALQPKPLWPVGGRQHDLEAQG